MTRIFTDGAEMRDMSFWSSIQGNIIVDSISPAISPYYYYSDGSTNAYKVFTAISEVYLRFRIKFGGFDPNIRFPRLSSAGIVVAWLQTDAAFRLVASATTIGVLELSAFVINPNQWYLFEWWYKMADAPNGRCQVKVDGTSVIDYTGDTKPAAGVSFDTMHFYLAWINTLYLDDLAMNDTVGAVDNSWCGDGVVVKLTPSGSGTINNFLNSGSTSGSSNYTYVGEFPSDSDTSNVYVSASSTGYKDQYRMSTFDGAGKNILRIYPEARIRKTRGDSSTIELGYLPSGGTDQLSGSQTVGIAYSAVVGTSASANPVTGLAWTASDLNLLEYIIKK
jgi:hypothetical protein